VIRKLALGRRTYIVLCILACATPMALVLTQIALGAPPTESAHNDMMFALIGTVAASLLTYPAGLAATILSWVPIYLGLLTPTESVLFAAPFYLAAGYLQWYVLMPRYFSVRGAAPGRTFAAAFLAALAPQLVVWALYFLSFDDSGGETTFQESVLWFYWPVVFPIEQLQFATGWRTWVSFGLQLFFGPLVGALVYSALVAYAAYVVRRRRLRDRSRS